MKGQKTTPVSVAAQRRPGLGTWLGATCLLVFGQLAASLAEPSTWVFVHPTFLFAVVLVAASGCAVAAVASLRTAIRENLPELGLTSTFAFAVSLLPLVHGITTPGVLYRSNPATMSSVLWAVPIGGLGVLPLILPRSRPGQVLLRNWDIVAGAHLGTILTVSGILLVEPTALPAPGMRTPLSAAVAICALIICLALSVRHLRLSWIAKSPGPLAVAVGFSSLGASMLVWFASGPFTAAFWLAHALDICGVFAITLVAVRTYRQGRPVRTVLRPLIAQTPMAALELGLDPLVHRFVASLERKDTITRDHVVRTAALAISVGHEMKLSEHELHQLGVGALLHDIGKLSIPDAIINKPGRLDEHEFAVMKGHVTAGEAMVAASSVLASAAPVVRCHHERVDGNGYPDGLAGQQIPLLARIVSACDAYDAMANTRQYRFGMGHDKACAILREHAGSQWDPDVVSALITVQERSRVSSRPLDTVGRDAEALGTGSDPGDAVEAWCGCGDALPEPILTFASIS